MAKKIKKIYIYIYIYIVFGYNFKIPAIVFADRHRFLPTTFVCGPYKESLDTFSGNPFLGSVIISIGTIHSATNFSPSNGF